MSRPVEKLFILQVGMSIMKILKPVAVSIFMVTFTKISTKLWRILLIFYNIDKFMSIEILKAEEWIG